MWQRGRKVVLLALRGMCDSLVEYGYISYCEFGICSGKNFDERGMQQLGWFLHLDCNLTNHDTNTNIASIAFVRSELKP